MSKKRTEEHIETITTAVANVQPQLDLQRFDDANLYIINHDTISEVSDRILTDSTVISQGKPVDVSGIASRVTSRSGICVLLQSGIYNIFVPMRVVYDDVSNLSDQHAVRIPRLEPDDPNFASVIERVIESDPDVALKRQGVDNMVKGIISSLNIGSGSGGDSGNASSGGLGLLGKMFGSGGGFIPALLSNFDMDLLESVKSGIGVTFGLGGIVCSGSVLNDDDYKGIFKPEKIHALCRYSNIRGPFRYNVTAVNWKKLFTYLIH